MMIKAPDASLRPQMERVQRIALIVGAVGLLATAVAFVFNRTQFFQSYLLAYIFWLGPVLGSFGFLMLQNVVGGRWSYIIKRPLEAGAMVLPLTAVLFLPILFGMQDLYLWARPEEVAKSEILAHKTPYLNVPFFIGRAAIYFLCWAGSAWLLRTWSLAQDKDPNNTSLTTRQKYLSGPGIVMLFLTVTFAAVDWGMSLEPLWFSSIYGVLYLMNFALTTLATMIVLIWMFGDRAPLNQVLNVDRIHDIGKLFFGFTVLWTYMNFSQYLIQWAGNLPEETSYYFHRQYGGWEYVGTLLIFGQFILPFFLLLIRNNKRRINTLVKFAFWALAMQLVDVFFKIKPAFSPSQFSVSPFDITAVIGVGGLVIWMLLRNLSKEPMLASGDERTEVAVRTAHSHH
jgi:hypothetical protein